MTDQPTNLDTTGLPDWVARRLTRSKVSIDAIWDGWTADIHGFAPRSKFVASTKKTYFLLGFDAIGDKTLTMLTDALLRYYLLPGKSDLQHPTHGKYGWDMNAKPFDGEN